MGLQQQQHVLPQLQATTTTAFTTAATSTSILRVSATGAIATGTFVLTCTDNIVVNGMQVQTFDIVSTKDTSALAIKLVILSLKKERQRLLQVLVKGGATIAAFTSTNAVNICYTTTGHVNDGTCGTGSTSLVTAAAP